MGNVASLELCKELHELSLWETGRWYRLPPTPGHLYNDAPKYDLGYLMRKLPPSIKENNCNYLFGLHPNYSGSAWTTIYLDNDAKEYMMQLFADTPEDAACKLAIELFKQGILTKEAP